MFRLSTLPVKQQLYTHYDNYNHDYEDDVFKEDFLFCLKYPKLNRYPAMRNFIAHYGPETIKEFLGISKPFWGSDVA